MGHSDLKTGDLEDRALSLHKTKYLNKDHGIKITSCLILDDILVVGITSTLSNNA